MNDDFNLDSLSETWQAQPVPKHLKAEELNKKLLIKKVSLFSLTVIDLSILVVVAGLLFIAFKDAWDMHLKLVLIFGLVSGGLATLPILKSRVASYKVITCSTIDWIEREKQMSVEALHRGKLTNYLVFAFFGALIVSFIYEFFILESPVSSLTSRYLFGVFWLVFVGLINCRHMKKHQYFLNTLH